MRREGESELQKALQALPDRQRQAVVLFYYENMSQREACVVMQISEGALESLLVRARSQLRARLAGHLLN